MGEHILLVDDEKEIADVMELYLAGEGYTVHKFYTGREALAFAERTPISQSPLTLWRRWPG